MRKDATTISVAGLKVIMTARNTFTNNRPEFNFERTPLTVLQSSPARVSNWIISLQAISISVTAVSFVCVGAVYAWNVHVQKNFDQQYRKLEALKQSERQLIVANESLGHDLITNLDRLPVKLIRERPQQSIFIIPAAPSPIKAVSKDTAIKLFDPLGY